MSHPLRNCDFHDLGLPDQASNKYFRVRNGEVQEAVFVDIYTQSATKILRGGGRKCLRNRLRKIRKYSDRPACRWAWPWLAWPWLAGPGWLAWLALDCWGRDMNPRPRYSPMRPQQFRLGPKIHVSEQTRAFQKK